MVRIRLRGGLLSLEFIYHCNKDGMGWDGMGCDVMWWNRDMVEGNGMECGRTELIIVIMINVWFRNFRSITSCFQIGGKRLS